MKNLIRFDAVATLLRWGLVLVFFYAALAALANSDNWMGYFPDPLFKLFGTHHYVLLSFFAIYEIFSAALLFLGRDLKVAMGLAFLALAGITLTNFHFLDMAFRDMGLAIAALALYVMAVSEDRLQEQPHRKRG